MKSSSSGGGGHPLVCIVNNTAKVNEIIGHFAEIGVTGATVIESHSTAEIVAEQLPVFAGFRQLLQANREANRTILSVMHDVETLERAMKVVTDACGDLNQPSTGIMFAVPVTHVKGLTPRTAMDF